MASITLQEVRKEFERASSAGGGLRSWFSAGQEQHGEVRVAALENLSLQISDREFFTVVGPSGCGKSTLLNLLAGLERQTAGEILFDETNVTERSPRERDVAMVFQAYALYPHMTVAENIAFPLRVRKFGRAEIDRQVGTMIESLGLTGLEHRRPKHLSGGQRQRVALARALVRRPKVFLLDEPLSNLDAALRLEMRNEIKRIHDRFTTTTVYVTHDQEEAMVLSDRILVLRSGIVQQCGTPREIFDRPENEFVARFIGSPPINLFAAEFVAEIGAEVKRRGGNASEVTCGIRPADISSVPPEAGSVDDRLSFQARIESISDTGTDRWAEVSVDKTTFRFRLPDTASGPPGESTRLYIDRAKLHFFDRTDGRRCSFC